MPELPEVETSRRGIAPHIEGKIFKAVVIRQPQLRWPVPDSLAVLLPGLKLDSVGRRGKYLLLKTSQGTLILHLGMSGNLRITVPEQAPGKHDHVDFIFDNDCMDAGGRAMPGASAADTLLRLNDQRKFGAVLWCENDVMKHPLLAQLGPEPLSDAFNGDYLMQRAARRNLPVKSLLMDSHIVVGVGNIYASESLFMAGILPTRPAGKISLQECRRLAESVKTVLQQAIDQGGTTLRDFTNAEGKPGYFKQALRVYGRAGQPCLTCAEPVQQTRIGQRSSYFCMICQH
ncbi:MAG: bifunctional DNA-formamidopyrimidine glycosylase/DNA-(apurinic or apyrimidinic site) lyase [Methylomonas sp.]